MFFAVLGVNVRVAVGSPAPATIGGVAAEKGADVTLALGGTLASGKPLASGGTLGLELGVSLDGGLALGVSLALGGTLGVTLALGVALGGTLGPIGKLTLGETLGLGKPLGPGGGGLRMRGVLGVRGVVLTESAFGIWGALGAGNALDCDWPAGTEAGATGGLSSDKLAVISIGAAFSVDKTPAGTSASTASVASSA